MLAWVNVINILRELFSQISFLQKITKSNCNLRKAAQFALEKKRARKMLMKLTPAIQ